MLECSTADFLRFNTSVLDNPLNSRIGLRCIVSPQAKEKGVTILKRRIKDINILNITIFFIPVKYITLD